MDESAPFREILRAMTENAANNTEQLVAAVVDAMNARDSDALMAIGHPGFEFHSRLVAVDGRVYRGRDGFADYFRDLDAAFANARFAVDEIVGWRGDDLVLVIRSTAEGHESRVPIDVTTPQVWTFREGKPWRSITYSSRAEALEAEGLSE